MACSPEAGAARARQPLAGLEARGIVFALVCAALAVLALTAVIREVAPPQAQTPAPATAFGNPPRPALSAAEEAYAAALWPIHEDVKRQAVNLIFAGLAYKTGDLAPAAFQARLRPLARGFEQALERSAKLSVPPPLIDMHEKYREAIRLHRESARIMAGAVAARRDEALISAQEKSGRAAELMLIVGDALWPGEYKPN